ncbi:MAG: xanthine dehydrogenase family protein molybdopterin-binding subunit [Deltaproteobacteria bacterium]|nr:xanthine dehydrogenase family protein molybdopterin-binding subunit [Deltaproteobacteria bacterium]
MAEYHSIGLPLARADGAAKVTGGTVFTADVLRPGGLWGKILRSPHAHARILHINTDRARRLPGVKAVITADDVDPKLTGRTLKDFPVLAQDRVRFVGDKVAAVAADDKDRAEEALSLVEVEYEELPAVYDPLEALAPDSPLIHPDYPSYHAPYTKAADLHNVQSRVYADKGDLEQGFAESDKVFEHTFRTQMVHQGYIEPYACMAEIDGQGRIRVWAATQSPFSARNQLAEYLDVPKDRIVFSPVTVGGSFGGKDHLIDIPLAYYLALATGKAVKIVRTYTEELMASAPRHPAVITLRSGVKSDGRLWAREGRVIYNGGAYGAFKPSPPAHMSGSINQGGAYRVPHTRLESLCVYTNQVPGGYMRASGELQTVFAAESHMDIIAHEMAMDPLEFRMLNGMVNGDSNYLGFEYLDIRCREVLLKAKPFWDRPKLAPRRPGGLTGRGIALACRHVGQGESGAEIALQADGTVRMLVGIVDQGTGVHTMQQQVVAEILGIAPERVTVEVGDTNRAPYHDGIKGQGATHVTGQAVARAAETLIENLRDKAAYAWDVDPESLLWENGEVVLKNDGRRMDMQEIAALSPQEPVVGQAYYKGLERPRQHIFQAEICDAEVDAETGEVEVRRMSTFHDVSVVINPVTHQGQIEGGLIQGLGMARSEEVAVDDGRVTTLSLGDYKMPNIKDVPVHETTLVEGATDGPGPFNAKPAAEHSITPVPPSVANAVFDATGVRITELPITAEKLLAGMAKKG